MTPRMRGFGSRRRTRAASTIELQSGRKRYTVRLDGWMRTFDRDDDALDCMELALSDACRLAVTCRGNTPVAWTLEVREYGMWVPHRRVQRRFVPFWRRERTEYRQNDVITAPEAGGGAAGAGRWAVGGGRPANEHVHGCTGSSGAYQAVEPLAPHLAAVQADAALWGRGRSAPAMPCGFRLALLLPGGDCRIHFLPGLRSRRARTADLILPASKPAARPCATLVPITCSRSVPSKAPKLRAWARRHHVQILAVPRRAGGWLDALLGAEPVDPECPARRGCRRPARGMWGASASRSITGVRSSPSLMRSSEIGSASTLTAVSPQPVVLRLWLRGRPAVCAPAAAQLSRQRT